jgi:transposase, IS5 family
VLLAESARGLVTQYDVLDGNPVDEPHVVISLVRHRQTFGDVPKLYGSDRGFFSERNVTSIYPDEQTFRMFVGMSETCQRR